MKLRALLGFLTVCTILGCEPVSDQEQAAKIEPLKVPKRDYILALAVDTSGSFIGEMFARDARGYRFMQHAVDRFFRDRMGADDHVLIAQLSGNKRPLLWEGTPRDLKRRFGDSETLRTFLAQASDTAGSRLYDGVAQTLEYVYSLPGVKEGETQVCVLVLSDMEDNASGGKARMVEGLRKLKGLGSGIGFYFVDIDRMEDTRQCLREAGLDPRFVESRIVENPPLPSFAEP